MVVITGGDSCLETLIYQSSLHIIWMCTKRLHLSEDIIFSILVPLQHGDERVLRRLQGELAFVRLSRDQSGLQV